MFVCVFLHACVRLFVCFLLISKIVGLSDCVYVCALVLVWLSGCLSVCLCDYLSPCLFVHLCVELCVCLCVRLCVSVFVSLSVSLFGVWLFECVIA